MQPPHTQTQASIKIKYKRNINSYKYFSNINSSKQSQTKMYLFKTQKVTVPSDLSMIGLDLDPFYRYKMQPLRISYEKKHTLLTNLTNVAKDLRIRPDYILEYFRLDLKTKYEQKEFKKRTEVRLKGFLEQQKLQRSLDKFIIDHLLCKKCLLPEVRYRSDVNRLTGNCKACGYFQIYDPRQDKIKELICNNPPVRHQLQIQKQEEDDLLYGNREVEYESCESDQDFNETEQQSDTQQQNECAEPAPVQKR